MKKTIIYFLRHGEVDNPKGILYGRLPRFRLSDEGEKKIKALASQFIGKEIKYIYTSPMLRARQTAAILGNILGILPKVSKLIIETNDIFAGMPLPIFRSEIQPKIYDKRYIRKGQESIESQRRRMVKFLKMIKRHHQGEKLIAVSHGDPILILKATTTGFSFTWEYKKANYLKPGEWLKLIWENSHYRWEKQ